MLTMFLHFNKRIAEVSARSRAYPEEVPIRGASSGYALDMNGT